MAAEFSAHLDAFYASSLAELQPKGRACTKEAALSATGRPLCILIRQPFLLKVIAHD